MKGVSAKGRRAASLSERKGSAFAQQTAGIPRFASFGWHSASKSAATQLKLAHKKRRKLDCFQPIRNTRLKDVQKKQQRNNKATTTTNQTSKANCIKKTLSRYLNRKQ